MLSTATLTTIIATTNRSWGRHLIAQRKVVPLSFVSLLLATTVSNRFLATTSAWTPTISNTRNHFSLHQQRQHQLRTKRKQPQLWFSSSSSIKSSDIKMTSGNTEEKNISDDKSSSGDKQQQPQEEKQKPKASTAFSPKVWEDGRNIAIENCVLPLSDDSHKGSSGRVGVLGGSARYTGAPYYAAMASLQVGADLAYIFCADEAAVPIKCYSPEVMVTPVYSASDFDYRAKQIKVSADGMYNDNDRETMIMIFNMVKEVTSMLDRLHVLIIGPGLGRCPLVMNATSLIIEAAMKRNVALVLDADALYLLTLEPYKHLVAGYDRAILTPNVIEYKRLVQANISDKADEGLADGMFRATEGSVVVRKGKSDVIFQSRKGVSRELVCNEVGGLKRSGGIGDILAGTLGTFLAWNRIMELNREQSHRRSDNPDDIMIDDYEQQQRRYDSMVLSAWSACCVVKRATKHAFDLKKRSMTAPDVLNKIGATVDEMTTK